MKLEKNSKQRIVGALVLLSLAVIFIPALFDPTLRHKVDTESQIPDFTLLEAEHIPEPVVPDVPAAEDDPRALFAGKDLEEPKTPQPAPAPQAAEPQDAAPEPQKNAQPQSGIVPKPPGKFVDSQGLPVSYVIQVISYSSAERAKSMEAKLLAEGYHAYWKKVSTSVGVRYRVLVGPIADKGKATRLQKELEKKYRLTAQLKKF